MRQKMIVGNWKMFKTPASSKEFVKAILPILGSPPPELKVVLCAPFTHLSTLSESLYGTPIHLGAQNLYWEEEGAYTGEISGNMLKSIGVEYVIVGHVERRRYFRETDQSVNLRCKSAQKSGLKPILFLGESQVQRNDGLTESSVIDQLEKGLIDIDQSNLAIVYEPCQKCCFNEVNCLVDLIRGRLSSPDIPILYAGSVNYTNIDDMITKLGIDGVVLGAASLEYAGFASIIKYVSSKITKIEHPEMVMPR